MQDFIDPIQTRLLPFERRVIGADAETVRSALHGAHHHATPGEQVAQLAHEIFWQRSRACVAPGELPVIPGVHNRTQAM